MLSPDYTLRSSNIYIYILNRVTVLLKIDQIWLAQDLIFKERGRGIHPPLLLLCGICGKATKDGWVSLYSIHKVIGDLLEVFLHQLLMNCACHTMIEMVQHGCMELRLHPSQFTESTSELAFVWHNQNLDQGHVTSGMRDQIFCSFWENQWHMQCITRPSPCMKLW